MRTVPGNQGFIAAILRLNGIYNNGEVMVYHPLMSKYTKETLHGRVIILLPHDIVFSWFVSFSWEDGTGVGFLISVSLGQVRVGVLVYSAGCTAS